MPNRRLAVIVVIAIASGCTDADSENAGSAVDGATSDAPSEDASNSVDAVNESSDGTFPRPPGSVPCGEPSAESAHCGISQWCCTQAPNGPCSAPGATCEVGRACSPGCDFARILYATCTDGTWKMSDGLCQRPAADGSPDVLAGGDVAGDGSEHDAATDAH